MEIKEPGMYASHALTDKERKNLVILEKIRKEGPISRTEISRTTGINVVSISNYIKEYLARDLILETGEDVSTGGRRPEFIELNKRGGHVIGIDIGATSIVVTLMDLGMDIIGTKRFARPATAAAITDAISLAVPELIQKASLPAAQVKKVAIGVMEEGLFPIGSAVAERLGLPVFVVGAAACAAFGEKRLNKKADVADLLYMYSDIGCGIVVSDDIYFGAGGSAGGIQVSNEHLSKEEEEVLFEHSKYLRPWGIDLGITEAARKEARRGIGTKIVEIVHGDLSMITKDTVIAAARQNDEVALDIIRSAALNLGIRIAYLVNLFNPEVVVIGGGIEKAGEFVLEPIAKTVKKFAFARPANIVTIVPSVLGEDAVSLGAASLAVREIFIRA